MKEKKKTPKDKWARTSHSLSHVDSSSNIPSMVDVSSKRVTLRKARARAVVELNDQLAQMFRDGDITSPKGPVFATAIVAGTMAAKKTSHLIPFCHPIAIENCKISITLENHQAVVDCVVSVHHKTGVEMEALTGASVAALTIYDMCKSVSHQIVIRDVRLIEKSGGKSSLGK